MLIDGYDIVATATCGESGGEVLVLNNNSTHYLVGVRREDDTNKMDVDGSYRYGEDDVNAVYMAALNHMVRLAGSR